MMLLRRPIKWDARSGYWRKQLGYSEVRELIPECHAVFLYQPQHAPYAAKDHRAATARSDFPHGNITGLGALQQKTGVLELILGSHFSPSRAEANHLNRRVNLVLGLDLGRR